MRESGPKAGAGFAPCQGQAGQGRAAGASLLSSVGGGRGGRDHPGAGAPPDPTPGKAGSVPVRTALSLPSPGLPSPSARGAGTQICTGSFAMEVRRGKASAEFVPPLLTPRPQNGFFHLFLL